MKKTIILLAAGAAMLAACDDDFTRPPLVLPPTVEVEPTVTIEQFKDRYWQNLGQGPSTVGYFNEDGDSVIFTGRVCSSDKTGNIYKSIIIQSVNEQGEQIAMTFSVNAYDIYEKYPFGQEVAVYATGLSIGGYHGLLQFGTISGSEMTFMPEDEFTSHVIRTGKGLPEPALVDTTITSIAEVNAAKNDEASLRLWQSRLVRVDGVEFADAGQPFAGTQTTNRYISDAEGNRLNVRNSSYADFSDKTLPYGKGSVVGILSYYNNDWQVLLLDEDGCIGFDGVAPEPDPDDPAGPATPEGEGTLESPYNVTKALEIIKAGTMTEDKVYIKGKISSIDEISTSFGNATYSISDDGTSANELKVFRGYWLGGEKFTATDQLEIGAEVIILGQLVNFMGNTPEVSQGNSIVSYNGQTAGGDTPTPGTPSGDGTLENPYNVARTLEIISAGTMTENKVYVKGKISSIDEISTSFGNATYSISDDGTTAGEFKIFRGYWLGGEKFTATDQLETGAEVIVLGQLINYMGNTPEMAQGNNIVSYNGQTAPTPPGPVDPDPVDPADPSDNAVNIPATAIGTLPGSSTVQGYTFDIQKASGATAPAHHSGTSAIRLYANNTMSISGARMAKIVITLAKDAGYRYTDLNPSTGSISPAQAKGDTSITWIGDATEVTFTVGAQATLGTESGKPGQIRFTTVEIYPAK